ncbi:hypothetical protein [Spirosoma pulveris]
MKTTLTSALLACFITLIIVSGCSTTPQPPNSDRLKRSYTLVSVIENGTVVYQEGAASNIKPGYGQFSLDLSVPPTVRYRISDGTSGADLTTFVGSYRLQNENTLILEGLNSQPTGTNGTITFTISDLIDGTSVTLTRTTSDPKAGNSMNVYRLRG